MDRKKVYKTANLLLFFLGLLFIIISKTGITGAAVAVPGGSSVLGSNVGLILVLFAFILFIGKGFFQKMLFSTQ
jgi:hypothetical protein